MRLKVPNLRED